MLDRGRGPARPMGETTGRYVAVLRERSTAVAVRMLEADFGLTVANSADFGGAAAAAATAADGADAVLFDRLGIAVVSGDPERLDRLAAVAGQRGSALLSLERERVVYPAGELRVPRSPDPARPGATVPLEYLRGFRDGVDSVVRAAGEAGGAPVIAPAEEFRDDEQRTWGLQAVGVEPDAELTGTGVAVAVLDTGLDFSHPDFAGREVPARSFIEGQEPQDGNGHGTHVAGVACGPFVPSQGPRYGVAPEATLFVGKVLADDGRGSDQSVLAGIDWAIASGCRILSMSLGAPVEPGEPHRVAFETAAQRAMEAGSLIVAAAGNESSRAAGIAAPVGHPANCPSILAVAAVDQGLVVADFSNGDQGLGAVDVAGPGVDVRSAWPVADGSYLMASGTSMATPHAAGVLALLAQARPQASPWELAAALLLTARRLAQQSTAVGAGLVQTRGGVAPTARGRPPARRAGIA